MCNNRFTEELHRQLKFHFGYEIRCKLVLVDKLYIISVRVMSISITVSKITIRIIDDM